MSVEFLNSFDMKGFGSDINYDQGQKKSFGPPLPIYKVWNPNPQNSSAPRTPGIVMVETVGEGEQREKKIEIVDRVRAVILYSREGRQLASGKGANWSIKCASDDGVRPAIRIDKPLCRGTTTQDLVEVIGKWRGYDKAKVDAKVAEVVNGDGKLIVCGIRGANGTIALCPYARKDPVTGNAGGCKPFRFVHAYDIDRKREFTMQLTGKSDMHGLKFNSPIHEFYKYLRTQGEVTDGRPCGHNSFGYRVVLSPAQDGNFYYLNVTDYQVIQDENNIKEMVDRAMKAAEKFTNKEQRLSKEAYEAKKAAQAQGQAATPSNPPQPVTPVTVAQPTNPVGTPSGQAQANGGDLTAKVKAHAATTPVSWGDDDINF